MTVLGLTISKVFCYVYLKMASIDDHQENCSLWDIVKSSSCFMFIFTISILILFLSILNIFNFPLLLTFFPGSPIIIILFYVVKEHEFTLPCVKDLVKTCILCRSRNIVNPSIADSTGGIYIGPSTIQA